MFFLPQKRLSEEMPAAEDAKKAKVDEPAVQDEVKSGDGEKVEEPKKDEAVAVAGEEELKSEKEAPAATVVPVEVRDQRSCSFYG